MWVSLFPLFFCFFAIFQVLQCSFLILNVFHCLWPYSGPFECAFLFFLVFLFSCHIPGPTVYISHFSRFSLFLAIFQVLACKSLIYFLVSFLAIFQIVQCVSHFPHFSVFLEIFQVLFCEILFFFQFYRLLRGPIVCIFIFNVFQCFSTYFTSYTVHFSFCMIFSFLTILQVPHCAFPIFHVF
jgi:hypothetical protein